MEKTAFEIGVASGLVAAEEDMEKSAARKFTAREAARQVYTDPKKMSFLRRHAGKGAAGLGALALAGGGAYALRRRKKNQ